jgi:hypothetical protein
VERSDVAFIKFLTQKYGCVHGWHFGEEGGDVEDDDVLICDSEFIKYQYNFCSFLDVMLGMTHKYS